MQTGVLIVALAGPVSNLLLAAVCVLLSTTAFVRDTSGLNQGVETLVMMNLGLAVFNLLPIPPLDGSRIADALMPRRLRPYWHSVSNVGFALLILLFLLPLVFRGINIVQLLFETLPI